MQANAKLSAPTQLIVYDMNKHFQGEEGMIYLLMLYMHIQVVRLPIRSLVICLLIDCMYC